ncbi:Type I restriction-modification system, restriction subunit R [hydrothermal vent metagenome]|uniref:type I site-specific deoxyribonuclease n=1 Tax=hydrothermal vent metagenome TaxID=652676 RepID=A0A3B1BNL1_9ZZZZ
MTQHTPKTQEEYSAKIPALQVLISMGYDYLTPEQCLALRGNEREVLLRETLIKHLQQYRFTLRGQEHALSTNAIEQVVRDIGTPGMNEGLLSANERVYNQLMLGITVTEFINAKKESITVPLINWHEMDKNVFQVTEELSVLNTAGTQTRRPDIVCFINGIPLVIIEAKRPDSHNPNKDMLKEGISQQIRNQKADEIPYLFAYSQLLLSINGIDGRYATTKTDAKFWTGWREEDFTRDDFNKIKNKPLTAEQKNNLFEQREPAYRKYFETLWSEHIVATEQDTLLISLLLPERLLEFVQYSILFDKKVGKIAARYAQAFAIKRLVEQISDVTPEGNRKGGVIWHTTGSGKSFTMVFLTKALLLKDELKKCRVVVVTDRIDLEKQLARTFLSGGAFGSAIATKKEGEKAKVSSGRELAKRIGQGEDRIIFTIINKFASASKLSECYNPSADMIVLVDEGHRGHGKENHERMRKALPNAAYVAFTGTPLLKDEKTINKFGPIVHAYTMQRAVEDGTVTPLLYEERQPELIVNEKAIDNWFEKITVTLSDEQKADLKKKFAQKGVVYSSDNRIELIAWDIATHFASNIKSLCMGLKGQIATDSKISAIRYKKHLDATGLVTSAVIISPPDTREGHESVDESTLPEVQQWWKDNIGNQPDDEYTQKTLRDFATDGAPDLLIVVDKLLTGFDEPRNTVLYIDKPLKEHNLIQAIARVNRLHEAKQYGLLIDYRGILASLDTAIRDYQDLAERTQSGYSIEDIDGLYHQMNTEYKRLPGLHQSLWDIFKYVYNKQDLEQYRQLLVPKWQDDTEGDSYDTNQMLREDFYQALTEFGLCLKVALSSSSFFADSSFSEADISQYKKDLLFFNNLRKIARQDAEETVDYSVYDEQLRRLVDKQVIGESVKEPDGVYIVGEFGKEEDINKWRKEKTRNETDIIRTRIKKTIKQDLGDDLYAQKVLSELLKDIIKEAEALFDHPVKQYALFKSFEEKVENRDIEGIPEALNGNRHAKAYYGTFRLVLGEDRFNAMQEDEIQQFTNEALAIDEVVNQAVAEHSLNLANIEAEIRKKLLPKLFKLTGMDKAKEIIEDVIHITRIGLSGGKTE